MLLPCKVIAFGDTSDTFFNQIANEYLEPTFRKCNELVKRREQVNQVSSFVVSRYPHAHVRIDLDEQDPVLVLFQYIPSLRSQDAYIRISAMRHIVNEIKNKLSPVGVVVFLHILAQFLLDDGSDLNDGARIILIKDLHELYHRPGLADEYAIKFDIPCERSQTSAYIDFNATSVTPTLAVLLAGIHGIQYLSCKGSDDAIREGQKIGRIFTNYVYVSPLSASFQPRVHLLSYLNIKPYPVSSSMISYIAKRPRRINTYTNLVDLVEFKLRRATKLAFSFSLATLCVTITHNLFFGLLFGSVAVWSPYFFTGAANIAVKYGFDQVIKCFSFSATAEDRNIRKAEFGQRNTINNVFNSSITALCTFITSWIFGFAPAGITLLAIIGVNTGVNYLLRLQNKTLGAEEAAKKDLWRGLIAYGIAGLLSPIGGPLFTTIARLCKDLYTFFTERGIQKKHIIELSKENLTELLKDLDSDVLRTHHNKIIGTLSKEQRRTVTLGLVTLNMMQFMQETQWHEETLKQYLQEHPYFVKTLQEIRSLASDVETMVRVIKILEPKYRYQQIELDYYLEHRKHFVQTLYLLNL